MAHRKSLVLATLLAFLLVAAVLWTYQDGVHNELLNWDDHRYLTYNPKIQALTLENLGWMLTSTDLDNWHPLTWLAHALVYHFYGLEPGPHHVVNILIHAANTLWVFVLFLALQALAARQYLLAASGRRIAIAALGALWFGIHPQHVESVMWVSERKDVLSLFFLFPAFITYCIYATGTARRAYWYTLSLLCFMLAIMAKPMAVSFPIVLLLADVYPLKRLGRPPRLPVLLEKLPFIGFAAVSVWLTLQAQLSWAPNTEAIPLAQRLLNAAHSLIFYIQKWLFPFNLSAIYPYPDYARLLADPQTLAAVAAFFLISTLALYRWTKGDALWAVLWGFYLVTLLPVIGIVQVGTQAAADRYAYLPTVPLYLLAAVACARLLRRRPWGLGVPLALAISLVLISLARQQTWHWHDDIVFRRHILAYDPEQASFQAALADEYRQRRAYKESISHYRAAIKLKPVKFDYYNNLIYTYLALDERQEALKVLQFLIDTRMPLDQPVLPDIYVKAAELYCLDGDFSKAEAVAGRALALSPAHRGTRQLLADIQTRACVRH